MSNPVLSKQFGHPETANAPIVTESGDRMTIGSVLSHTGIMFALLLVGAFYGWTNVTEIGGLFWGVFIATIALLIVVFLHMVVGEMAPKSLAISNPERSALLLARPFRAFTLLFRPTGLFGRRFAGGAHGKL